MTLTLNYVLLTVALTLVVIISEKKWHVLQNLVGKPLSAFRQILQYDASVQQRMEKIIFSTERLVYASAIVKRYRETRPWWLVSLGPINGSHSLEENAMFLITRLVSNGKARNCVSTPAAKVAGRPYISDVVFEINHPDKTLSFT